MTESKHWMVGRILVAVLMLLLWTPGILWADIWSDLANQYVKLKSWIQTIRTFPHRYPQKERTWHSKYDPLIVQISRRYRLHPALVKAVIHAESNFDAFSISHKGAMGLMQLMPATAEMLGVRDAFDPRDNIDGGCRYLSELLDEFGSLKKALIAYNAGPEVARTLVRIPRETRGYVKRVIWLYRQYWAYGLSYQGH